MLNSLRDQIHEVYGNKIRVRACGCLIREGKILLLNHQGLGDAGYFWNVPGGGPEKGESLQQAIEREFMEETGLEVRTEKFLCLQEYINPPLHAIELYFRVAFIKGEVRLGSDPENVPLLHKIGWFDESDFANLPVHTKPNFLTAYFHLD